MKNFLDYSFFRFNLALPYCFSLLSVGFCRLSHFEIIRYIAKSLIVISRYSFVEIQLKKENLKCFLDARVWAPKPVYRSPIWPEYATVQIYEYQTQMYQLLSKIYLQPQSRLTLPNLIPDDKRKLTYIFISTLSFRDTPKKCGKKNLG